MEHMEQLNTSEVLILTALAMKSSHKVAYRDLRSQFATLSRDTTNAQDALLCRRGVLSLHKKGLLSIPDKTLPAIVMDTPISLTAQGWNAIDALPIKQ